MERDLFQHNLAKAVTELLPMTREFIEEPIPDEHIFRVTPNQSNIGSPCIDSAITTFPEDTLPEGQSLGPWSAEQAIEYLWRNGKIPRWIQLYVEDIDEGRAMIQLRCSSQYVKDESLMDHVNWGRPPFACCVKPWPSDFSDMSSKAWSVDLTDPKSSCRIQPEQKYSLYWNQQDD